MCISGIAIIYIAAVALGLVSGAAAGAVGHSIADILTGHTVFVLPTFIIKGLMGFVVGKILYRHTHTKHILLASDAALVIITLGYFVAEALIFGAAAMLVFVSSPAQWLMSVAATVVLMPLLKKAFKAQR